MTERKLYRGQLLQLVSVLLVILISCGLPAYAQDSASAGRNTVKIYFFWGDGCPHCANEKKFLDDMKKNHPGIIVESYEVWKNRPNAGFFIWTASTPAPFSCSSFCSAC